MKPLAAITIFLLFVSCNEKQKDDGTTELQVEDQALHVPELITETIDDMVAGLPEDGRKAIAAMKDEDEMSMYHHGWGTGLRNSLGLWGDSELAKAFNEVGIWHADDMSAILLDSVWRRVHEQDLDIEEQVAFYEAYWIENKEIRDEPCPQCSEILGWRQSFPLVYADQPDLSVSDYNWPDFPEVEKTLQWYRCPQGHEYIRTSEAGFSKPQKKHLNARRRLDEADSKEVDPFGN